ncbi:barstar family protein [Crenobacter cavernae]|nr:barstar family protein [Crenobacter cavernae]
MPPMKTCLIEKVDTLNELYDALIAQLDLPAHFGRNLDALFDCLSADVEGPFTIEWRNTDAARTALGATVYAKVIDLLREVADERDDVTLRLEP